MAEAFVPPAVWKRAKRVPGLVDGTARDESRLRFGILQRCADDARLKDELEILWFTGFRPKFYGRVPDFNQGGNMTDRVRLQISSSLLNKFDGVDMVGKRRGLLKRSSLVSPASSERLTARTELRHELQCLTCGETFRHVKHNIKFCSRQCFKVNRLGEDFEMKAEKLYTSGYSLRQVGAKLGVSYGTVRKHLIAQGVELRSSHPSNRI